jgi:hypothetical protein
VSCHRILFGQSNGIPVSNEEQTRLREMYQSLQELKEEMRAKGTLSPSSGKAADKSPRPEQQTTSFNAQVLTHNH